MYENAFNINLVVEIIVHTVYFVILYIVHVPNTFIHSHLLSLSRSHSCLVLTFKSPIIHSVYEAMESFAPENEDEVGFSAGERLHVISKSMDGWWKIRYV